MFLHDVAITDCVRLKLPLGTRRGGLASCKRSCQLRWMTNSLSSLNRKELSHCLCSEMRSWVNHVIPHQEINVFLIELVSDSLTTPNYLFIVAVLKCHQKVKVFIRINSQQIILDSNSTTFANHALHPSLFLIITVSLSLCWQALLMFQSCLYRLSALQITLGTRSQGYKANRGMHVCVCLEAFSVTYG